MHSSKRAMRDLTRGVAALAFLLGLVVGVPVGLLSLAGWPLPPSGTN